MEAVNEKNFGAKVAWGKRMMARCRKHA